ncbi:cytochrome c [Rhizobium sp. RU36D]|uniref:c-type cytochrome n=1 Tax=Rhizobium sp. RU36D TaxID=1907415 RepID=UPI0009D8A1CD|nr:cytochrome c [Rhizobium sp. RU36D]SMD19136.1 Cytochrome c, mono-and diheme variants [Rhizobium sp. RU36D]
MASIWLKTVGALAALGVIGGVGFVMVTRPAKQPESHWANLGEPDLANGERIFWAGGCVSCHAAPGAEGEAKLVLSGGAPLKSPFGTFHAPNISPDPNAGIGAWTLAEFGDAMTLGTGRNGEHLYPSFPYGSYVRLQAKDINDLYGFMKTLPASNSVAPAHELPFPFNVRLVLGGWKFLYFNDEPRVTLASADDKVKRGQYLVEGPGHCGECHTPRDALGGFKSGQWLAGGPNPEGEGSIPNITPGSKSMGGWSESEIVEYLTSGFTPDFDSVGGSMVEVQKNMAQLPAEDREAIAAYLKAIPAVQ